jgi:hypothetical protein
VLGCWLEAGRPAVFSPVREGWGEGRSKKSESARQGAVRSNESPTELRVSGFRFQVSERRTNLGSTRGRKPRQPAARATFTSPPRQRWDGSGPKTKPGNRATHPLKPHVSGIHAATPEPRTQNPAPRTKQRPALKARNHLRARRQRPGFEAVPTKVSPVRAMSKVRQKLLCAECRL